MNREYEDLKKLYQSSMDNSQTADNGCPDEDKIKGAAEYRIVLLDEELIEVWASEKIQRTSLKLPQLHSEAIKSGRIYYWKVVVFSSDGNSLESSYRSRTLYVLRINIAYEDVDQRDKTPSAGDNFLCDRSTPLMNLLKKYKTCSILSINFI